MSKKRPALMRLVQIKTLAVRIAGTGEAFEPRDAALGVVLGRQLLKVVSDELVEALAKSVRSFASTFHSLLID